MERLRREVRALLVAVLLASPAAIPYVWHYNTPIEGARPTGFLMGDMPYYMANAREHFDDGGVHLTYGNPFSPRYETERVYFQPMTLLLGTAWKLTDLDPGVIFVAFGAIAAVACTRVAMALYRHVFGLATWAQRLGMVAFLWGGGFLALAGAIRQCWVSGSPLLHFDPGQGFWFLNLGRNLVFPTEAFYHALFLGVVLLLLRRQFVAALGLAAVLSWSHPFTGIELLLIVSAWAALERWYLESPALPRWVPIAACGLVAMHLGYYLGVLTRNAEHRALMEQWTLAWTLPRTSALLGLALVGVPTLWRLRRWRLAQDFLGNPDRRLFAVWFVVAFALVKHEVFLTPVQPLHFDRGYPWTALFCLGGGAALVSGFDRLLRFRVRAVGWAAAMGVLAIVVLDNAAWIGRNPLRHPDGEKVDMHVTREQDEVLAALNDPAHRSATLLTTDGRLAYYATVYTPLRSWISHPYNTPRFDRRLKELGGLVFEGKVLDHWRSRPVVVVMQTENDALLSPAVKAELGLRPILQNGRYRVYGASSVPAIATRRGVDPGSSDVR